MTDHTGLPSIPALSADRESWIQSWRQALGAYRLMAGYLDHLTDRWAQEMAQAYLEPWYNGDPADLPQIRMIAQRLGPLYLQAVQDARPDEQNTPADPASCKDAQVSGVELPRTENLQENQLDFFEELSS
ncbi:hypothetical protein B1757_02505 [Acidithiobacillus marinus]|uniref:Uncharacterized protein n=1 Tax=Acidithiobacillus marinus TaxID=187490 RepID=A0A2I1DPQ0_9PROT|nr:hypothetical protein [Acidithiobacillus marinus]PKY11851.1 hypothetical protein B1757_02505 [Acidithiobacillus marinus]